MYSSPKTLSPRTAMRANPPFQRTPEKLRFSVPPFGTVGAPELARYAYY